MPTFEYNTNPSTADVKVLKNATVTLTGSVYGKVEIEENATLIFTEENIFIKELKIKEGSTVKFTQCAHVRVLKKIEAEKECNNKPRYVTDYNLC